VSRWLQPLFEEPILQCTVLARAGPRPSPEGTGGCCRSPTSRGWGLRIAFSTGSWRCKAACPWMRGWAGRSSF